MQRIGEATCQIVTYQILCAPYKLYSYVHLSANMYAWVQFVIIIIDGWLGTKEMWGLYQ